jgi:phosphate acyltransferase
MAEFLMKTVSKSMLSALDVEREKAGQVLNQLSQTYRYQESGGAPLLGIDGSCIICHGSSDADSIRNALKMAMKLQAHQINAQIVEQLAEAAAVAASE